MKENHYRRSIAVFIVNDAGLILTCERSDHAGAWQLPQGGIEEGETPQEAMNRELLEEIGTNSVEIVGELPATIRYDWPEHLHSRGYCGQEQHYFLARLLPSARIDFNKFAHAEFQSYRWLAPAEFKLAASGFKREAYLQALAQFQDLYPSAFSL